jgi:adiponectin receptor
MQFPEKWFRCYFDIFGASHQILHVLVVLAALAHTMGLLQMMAWVKAHPNVCSN